MTTEERAIKGTMLIDIAKAIRTIKDKPWDDYLTDESRELISQRILPSVWYPFDPFLNCLNAVYELVGGKKPEMARAWGKINGRRLFETVYQTLANQSNTREALRKLEIIGLSSFIKNFSFEVEELEDYHFNLTSYDNDPRTEPIYYFIQGWIEALIEMSGSEVAKLDIIDKHWKNGNKTVFEVEWR